MGRKLIASGEESPVSGNLKSPCSDCPMRRDSLPSWLGGSTPEEYAHLAHSDIAVECHVHEGSRCVGMGIYRRNVCQWEPERLEANHELCFSNRMEFLEHHKKKKVTRTRKRRK